MPAEATQLRLQLDSFEGPLELLLSLVESRRLPITQVSLAQVADQYMVHLHREPALDPDRLADFLSIGGKLLLLKSRALLLSDDPDPVVAETASDLEARLAEYRLFRAAAQQLQEIEARGERSYATAREPSFADRRGPLAPISPDRLAAAYRGLLQAATAAPAEIILTPHASVETKRSLILDALRLAPFLSFNSIAGCSVDAVVATFLAVLELFRRHLIVLHQGAQFGDIQITRRADAPPGSSL